MTGEMASCSNLLTEYGSLRDTNTTLDTRSSLGSTTQKPEGSKKCQLKILLCFVSLQTCLKERTVGTFVGRQSDDLDLPRCDGVGQPQNVPRHVRMK